jgi:hypothetical protein
MQPRPARELADRDALDEVQPPYLGPLLHTNHLTSSPPGLPRPSEGPSPTGRLIRLVTRVTFRVLLNDRG